MSIFGKPAKGPTAQRSPVIEDLAQLLRHGPVGHRLNVAGINRVWATYLGRKFEIAWFSGGDLYEIHLGGDRYFSTKDDAEYLVKVARERADCLFDEKVAELEKLRVQAHER